MRVESLSWRKYVKTIRMFAKILGDFFSFSSSSFSSFLSSSIFFHAELFFFTLQNLVWLYRTEEAFHQYWVLSVGVGDLLLFVGDLCCWVLGFSPFYGRSVRLCIPSAQYMPKKINTAWSRIAPEGLLYKESLFNPFFSFNGCVITCGAVFYGWREVLPFTLMAFHCPSFRQEWKMAWQVVNWKNRREKRRMQESECEAGEGWKGREITSFHP